MSVDQTHEEKQTLSVEVNLPGHAPRTQTSLFERTRKALIERDGGCWICGCLNTHDAPLQSHHYPVERSLATAWDWPRFIRDCKAGAWGVHAQAFDWDSFNPANPYSFVDDQTVNGMLLCESHHIGKDTGIHTMPHPLWVWQRYAPDGYRLSDVEIVHHQS